MRTARGKRAKGTSIGDAAPAGRVCNSSRKVRRWPGEAAVKLVGGENWCEASVHRRDVARLEVEGLQQFDVRFRPSHSEHGWRWLPSWRDGSA